jgi:hypothetical protein
VGKRTFYRLADDSDAKRCPKCGRTLTVADFGVDQGRRGGRKSLCRPCDAERARAYYRANRERVLARGEGASAEGEPGVVSEPVFESAAVSVVRLNGRPRAAVTGRHKAVLVYVGATVTVSETIWLLRETAEALAKTLPRFPE